MKLMAYTNDDCTDQNEVNALYMDGYEFGDRLLEGVVFELKVFDGQLKATCLDKYDPGINWTHWENICAERAIDSDTLSTTRTGSDDLGFVER